MHHLAVKTCLFQRKMGVHVLPEEDPCTYTSLCRDSRVYGGLMDISRDRLWLKIFWYGSDRDHLAQVQGEQINIQWCIVGILLEAFGSSSQLLLVSGGTKEEGEQKEILVADLNGDWQMLLLSVIGDFHKYFVSMSCISFVVSLLWCQGHVMAYFGFPTMPGMNM